VKLANGRSMAAVPLSYILGLLLILYIYSEKGEKVAIFFCFYLGVWFNTGLLPHGEGWAL
jgi:hypothetical protein